MANLLQNQGAYCQGFPPGGGLMKVRTFALGLVMTGFTLASAVPALAQNPKVSDPGGGSGARSNPGSSGGGETAVSRGGGSAAATTSSGGGSATTSSSNGGSSAGAVSTPSSGFGSFAGAREAAPSHRFSDRNSASANDGQKATPRSASGGSSSASGSSGGSATPRGSSAAPASGGNNRSSGGGNGARSRTNPDNSNNASGTREVPTWSRPRGDQPVTGSAVTRTGPPPNQNGSYNGSYGGGYY